MSIRSGSGSRTTLRHRAALTSISLFAVGVLSVALAAPASAAEGGGVTVPDTPDQVASQAAQTATDVGAAISAAGISDTSAGFVSTAGGAVAPKSTSGEITFGFQTTNAFTISLPKEIKQSVGVRAHGSTLVYGASKASHAAVSVRLGTGVAQQVITIKDASAASSYTFALDKRLTPTLNADGSIYLSAPLSEALAGRTDNPGSNSAENAVVSAIAPAWAVDANGQPVATHYEIKGNSVVQVVDFTADTAFPVIADPTVSWYWWGASYKYNRSETRQAADAADSGYPMLAATLCGLIGIPVGAVACGVLVGAGITYAGNVFKSARSQGKCVRLDNPFVGVPSYTIVTC